MCMILRHLINHPFDRSGSSPPLWHIHERDGMTLEFPGEDLFEEAKVRNRCSMATLLRCENRRQQRSGPTDIGGDVAPLPIGAPMADWSGAQDPTTSRTLLTSRGSLERF